MNICTPDNCICDAAEWEGDTNCFGVRQSSNPDTQRRYYEEWLEEQGNSPYKYSSSIPSFRVYYLDQEIWPGHSVIISIDDPAEIKPGVDYYYDPDMTRRVR